MNITSIQAGQFSQNAIRPAEKSDFALNTGIGSPAAAPQNEPQIPQVSTQGIAANVSYLKDKLDMLLTSYPPFFPAGSPQKLDLIKKIRSLEEQIGLSKADDTLKKSVSENRLPDSPSDQDISAALDRLTAFSDAVKQTKTPVSEPVNPGIIVNVKV